MCTISEEFLKAEKQFSNMNVTERIYSTGKKLFKNKLESRLVTDQ